MKLASAIRYLALVLAVALCLATAYGAYELADYSWNQVVDYESPFVARPLPETTSGPQPDRLVCLVIVDGLTEDASREMGGLNALRGYGGDLVAIAPQPSLSYPNWTTILSGAPPQISGVTTNWFEGAVPVETLIDTTLRAGIRSVVAGPESFEELYGARRIQSAYLEDWAEGTYLSSRLVDNAIRLARETTPTLVIVHLPDADEVAHEYGTDSDQYADVTNKIDADISRLVGALQSDRAVFVVVSDHGHVAAGGHGGWEPEVVRVPAVFAGAGVLLHRDEIALEDVAPTVAVLAGVPVPRHARGRVVEMVIADKRAEVLEPARSQRRTFTREYVRTVLAATDTTPGVPLDADSGADELTGAMNDVDAIRLEADREDRLLLALGIVAAILAIELVIGFASWRALLAVLAGTVAYYVLYNAVYFLVRGHQWSLSAFNEESLVQTFFYTRMGEAAGATLFAAAVAGLVYPYLRSDPKGPRRQWRSGWLALGGAVPLTIMATLALQVAWYFWAWGIDVTWRIPDLRWGFKYDLDLVQATAVGAAAILTPLVTYLVGRYHPRVRRFGGDDRPGGEVGVSSPPRTPVGVGPGAFAPTPSDRDPDAV